MKTAKIWKSIEALNDEAADALKKSTPEIVVVKSAPLPAFALEYKVGVSNLNVLKSIVPPPTATLAKKYKNDNVAIEESLSIATMAEIAVAIDRASKMPKATSIDQSTETISDDFRQDLLTEVGKAVQIVLAAELPKLVRYAVLVSIHELLTAQKKPKTQKTEPDKAKRIAQKGQKSRGK